MVSSTSRTSKRAPGSARARGRRTAAITALALCVLGVTASPSFAGAIISNGTVKLGVNDSGDLNFRDPVTNEFRGVTYVPTDNDGTRAGCECEGWGAGNGAAGDTFSGYANEDRGGANNLDPVSFTSTASTAVSVTSIDNRLRVTQDFHPFAGSRNLYEVTVTLRNIGTTTIADPRYTRLMDWDVEPTAFSEFVTIQRGTASSLRFSNDNGFASGDPLENKAGSSISAGTENTNFTDSGPADHGAAFDFKFPALAPNAERKFTIYYGAAANEASANASVGAASIEVYSYGQPNGGQTTGAPNTFIFAFKGVGGTSVIPVRRMVGKGTVTGGGTTAAYSYILNCDAAANENAPFEVRFGSQKFRLDTASAVSCTDDPGVPTPTAGFDTQTGTGTGTLTTGGPGTVQWKFVDGGTGGANDSVQLTIKDAGGATVFTGTGSPPGAFPGSDQPTGRNTARRTTVTVRKASTSSKKASKKSSKRASKRRKR